MNAAESQNHDSNDLPMLYGELADWFPILTAPEDYAEEAEFYRQALISACQLPPKTLLELGSGGGNNASHLKKHFKMTLVDLSEGMLEVSRKLNPECDHIQGDMRKVRLGVEFEAVFIHDAVMYMTTWEDLRQAVETAYLHCRVGGAALFAPDCTRETFVASTEHGGHDRGHRGLRYLSWTLQPDPGETISVTYMVYLMRHENREIRCVLDKHVCGLFSRATWMETIQRAGFIPRRIAFEHSQVETGAMDVFLGIKEI